MSQIAGGRTRPLTYCFREESRLNCLERRIGSTTANKQTDSPRRSPLNCGHSCSCSEQATSYPEAPVSISGPSVVGNGFTSCLHQLRPLGRQWSKGSDAINGRTASNFDYGTFQPADSGLRLRPQQLLAKIRGGEQLVPVHRLLNLFMVLCFPLLGDVHSAAQCSRTPTTSGLLLLLLLALLRLAQPSDGCSTRPSPKPRPARPYWRPRSSVPRVNCTEDYVNLFCLNGGTCVMQADMDGKVNAFCECMNNYTGLRCEDYNTPNRVLPVIYHQKMETAALSAAVTLLILVAFLVTVSFYVYKRRTRQGEQSYSDSTLSSRPFSSRRLRRDSVAPPDGRLRDSDEPVPRHENGGRVAEPPQRLAPLAVADEEVGLDDKPPWPTSPTTSL